MSLLYFQKLDFENPNERKFLLLVVATEEKTAKRLSSSATVTVEVEDLNDNHPQFDKESYTASIPEKSQPGKIIQNSCNKQIRVIWDQMYCKFMCKHPCKHQCKLELQMPEAAQQNQAGAVCRIAAECENVHYEISGSLWFTSRGHRL